MQSFLEVLKDNPFLKNLYYGFVLSTFFFTIKSEVVLIYEDTYYGDSFAPTYIKTYKYPVSKWKRNFKDLPQKQKRTNKQKNNQTIRK